MKTKRKKIKCKARCGKSFFPAESFHVACSIPCAIKINERKKKTKRKKQKQIDKKALEALQPRSYWIKKAQKAFNKYIRERDKGQPCISCQRKTGAKINAGHYLSTGARPDLRFNPMNCHLQCEHCNSYKSGNITLYRENLIDKVGLEMVEYLENFHTDHILSVEEIKEIEAHYKQLYKQERENND